jgi:hypothetical protein
MADMKVDVDMSELDAALEKAVRLSAMLDEIEGRFASLDGVGFGPVASAPTSPPPPKPKR